MHGDRRQVQVQGKFVLAIRRHSGEDPESRIQAPRFVNLGAQFYWAIAALKYPRSFAQKICAPTKTSTPCRFHPAGKSGVNISVTRTACRPKSKRDRRAHSWCGAGASRSAASAGAKSGWRRSIRRNSIGLREKPMREKSSAPSERLPSRCSQRVTGPRCVPARIVWAKTIGLPSQKSTTSRP